MTSFRGTETRSPVPCPPASVVCVKPFRALLLYLAVVFIGAAMLAPIAMVLIRKARAESRAVAGTRLS